MRTRSPGDNAEIPEISLLKTPSSVRIVHSFFDGVAIGAGLVAKMINQLIVGCIHVVMAEAASMAEAAGIDAAHAPRSEVLKRVEPEDLLSFGFIPEFIGRLPAVSVLDELTEEDLVRILTEPKNALVKQFAKLFALDGVELHVTPDACRELAAEAIKKGTGARALRSLLERLMRDLMFEIPTSADVAGITVNSATVRGEAPPLIRRRTEAAAA